MRRAPQTAERFFPNSEDGISGVVKLGYFPVRVSVFDHYLTQDECDDCDVLAYRHAVKVEKTAEYEFGEQSFLTLYRNLAKNGAYIEKNDNYWLANPDDVAFDHIFIESLREWGRIQAFFIGPQIRLLGHDDRTDLLLLRSKEYLPKLEELVRRVGLHTLPFKSR